MDDLHAFAAEDAVEVEVLDVQRPADFAGAVVGDARAARAVAAVGQVELVAIAPGAALLDFLALVVDVPAGEVVLDEAGDRDCP